LRALLFDGLWGCAESQYANLGSLIFF